MGAVRDRSFEFALEIVELYRRLSDEREYVVSKQLLRSGTSIGANVEEATAAESRKDFIHKMTIAAKEARESRYWLRLLSASNLTRIPVTDHLNKCEELIKLLSSIVKTAQSRLD